MGQRLESITKYESQPQKLENMVNIIIYNSNRKDNRLLNYHIPKVLQNYY